MFLFDLNLVYILAILFVLENVVYISLSKLLYVQYIGGNDHLEWQMYKVYKDEYTRIFSSEKFKRFFRIHNRLTIMFCVMLMLTIGLFIVANMAMEIPPIHRGRWISFLCH